MKALKIAATGMAAQQTRLEIISNNISNMNTTGFNARRAEFSDLPYQQMVPPGSVSASDGTVLPTGVQLGLGVQPSSVSINIAQGALSQTNGDLDVAIDGEGFLEVNLPSGQTAYTRDGALKRNAEGLVVNSQGYALSDEIFVPNEATNLTINADGGVFALLSGDNTPTELGQITLAGFTNPAGLEAIGDNLFVPNDASGEPALFLPGQEGIGTVRQGYLEDSSVDPVKELTELIEAQRGYELNAKVISAVDQMLAAATQIR